MPPKELRNLRVIVVVVGVCAPAFSLAVMDNIKASWKKAFASKPRKFKGTGHKLGSGEGQVRPITCFPMLSLWGP